MFPSPPETRVHGPCETDGESIIIVEAKTRGLSKRVRDALRRRRNLGMRKYGGLLKSGWEDADVALAQELLDGVDYALVGGHYMTARVLGLMAHRLLNKIDRREAVL